MTNVTEECLFCNIERNVLPERKLFEYRHWTLILQLPEKLATTKQSAGLLIAKRHIVEVSDASADEAAEFVRIIKDASKRLCEAVGTTYLGQETVGFNQGGLTGQTIFHAHIHILPLAEEDPEEMKGHTGIGAAFKALRKERVK